MMEKSKCHYAQLYHLPYMLPGSAEAQKAKRILQYLEAQSPQLKVNDQLEAPIPPAELATVIKDIPKGKSQQS